jgi:hypothetical protein
MPNMAMSPRFGKSWAGTRCGLFGGAAAGRLPRPSVRCGAKRFHARKASSLSRTLDANASLLSSLYRSTRFAALAVRSAKAMPWNISVLTSTACASEWTPELLFEEPIHNARSQFAIFTTRDCPNNFFGRPWKNSKQQCLIRTDRAISVEGCCVRFGSTQRQSAGGRADIVTIHGPRRGSSAALLHVVEEALQRPFCEFRLDLFQKYLHPMTDDC